MRVSIAVACSFVVMAIGWPIAANAQLSPASDPKISRVALAERAKLLEQQLSSNTAGKSSDRVRAELDSIQLRLTEGDFAVGDQFVITIVWDTTVSDTASVREGKLVSVRTLSDFSVRGVLRSELTERLNAHVARYLRNATVRTNVFTRVSVTGAVARPGFYSTSPDRPISEVIMLGGGPAPQAKLNELEIWRAGREILSRKASKKALLDGRTLEQLGVRSGDEIRIPVARKINWQFVVQIFLLASTLLFSFLQFIQWYYRDQ